MAVDYEQKASVQGASASGGKEVILKVALVGDPGVGKTTLSARYTYTNTGNVLSGSQYKTITMGDEMVKLQILDYQGHTQTQSIAPNRQKDPRDRADIIILAFDITYKLSFEHLKIYIEECQRSCGVYTKYVVVGCKSDLTNQRVVSSEDAKVFADGFGYKYYETSAKTGQGVVALFEGAAREQMTDRRPRYYPDVCHVSPTGACLEVDARQDIKLILALPDSLAKGALEKVKLILEYRINRIAANAHNVGSEGIADGKRKNEKLRPLLELVREMIRGEPSTDDWSKLKTAFAQAVNSEYDGSDVCLSKHRNVGGWLANRFLSPVRVIFADATIKTGAMENLLECKRIVDNLCQQQEKLDAQQAAGPRRGH